MHYNRQKDYTFTAETPMKDTVALLKKRLQGHGYGNYDLLVDLFSEADLLNKKPGTLYFLLSDLVGSDTILLNKKSFYTWLSRYRKKYNKNSATKPKKSWKEFTPSDLRTAITQPEPIILEIVKPKKI